MQNLETDLTFAIEKVLCGTWRERKQMIDKVFTKDAKFWHLFHNAHGRDNIHGIYQFWAFTNYPPLKIKFLRVAGDKEANIAIVDLLEYCNVWPMPPWTFFGGPVMRLHVIFGFEDTPEGKKINYQEDHSMWTESLLFHTLPRPVGDFLENHWLPLMGKAVAGLGHALYQCQVGDEKEINFQQVDGGQNGTKGGSGLLDVRRDLPKAVRRIFSGTPAQRKAAIHELYSEDAVVWNATYIVRGRQAIFGAFQLWCALNHIKVKINRIVPAGDLVLVDAVQEARPRFLPDFVAPWVVWNHIVLRLGDSPDGRGKVIVRHENHPMGTEATLIYNLWIFSWLINLIRRLMGIVFGFGGRVLYMALETYHGQKVIDKDLWDAPVEFMPPDRSVPTPGNE
ncbi:g4224 [Coccomyxa viridis]|uniref:G4224 protein n=1 Tax=Coccomyxa viridis TaxID=1274662 RepID=A0ABP1FV34_9CHLO